MNASQIYIIMSVVVLAVITLVVFFVSKNKKARNLSPLTGLAFGFILAGILFGENRFIGYGLMGVGEILAVVDIFNKSRKNNNPQ